ncbi:MAG: hypothetical protein JXB26_16620 [Candidatus Aminicenantes bacterium]|nr:hypothetical protein [Candidatus Aminicenantes bacterium]
MGYAKNHQTNARQKRNHLHKRAYRPKPPFKAVEGVGSNAYKLLSRDAVWVLMKFYEEFNGYNRNNLKLPYREANISTLVFNRSIWELLGYGFIDLVKAGRLEKECSVYALSNHWRKLSEKPEALKKIKELLEEINVLKRQPGGFEKRKNIRVKRKKILALSKNGRL